MSQNIIREKSFQFALDVIVLCRTLKESREYVFADQLLRSGTSIGANIEEAQAAQSRKDFASKMAIASKEARESLYWLRLIIHGRVLADICFAEKLVTQCDAIVNILTSIVRTARG